MQWTTEYAHTCMCMQRHIYIPHTYTHTDVLITKLCLPYFFYYYSLQFLAISSPTLLQLFQPCSVKTMESLLLPWPGHLLVPLLETSTGSEHEWPVMIPVSSQRGPPRPYIKLPPLPLCNLVSLYHVHFVCIGPSQWCKNILLTSCALHSLSSPHSKPHRAGLSVCGILGKQK